MSGNIDTHQHFLPPVYVDAIGVDALAAVMPNRKAPLPVIRSSVATLSEMPISETLRTGIFRDNAARLLGR